MRVATTSFQSPGGHPEGEARASLANGSCVTADGEGLVSHAGTVLLTELADRLGFTDGLSEAMAPTRERRSAHEPGRVLRDLCVSIADGGDCVSDLGVLRGQEVLFGTVASETTTHRVVKAIDSELLDAVRAARATARARAWDAGARPETITLDIDATLVSSHSDKEEAAGNYKSGFGFHPLHCYLDETGEALAGLLRPGNASSNTARDHFEVLARAPEQLPAEDLDRETLVRADAGGTTHAFTADCRDADLRFSVGYELTEAVREAIPSLDQSAWQAAIEADGRPREGASVAELHRRGRPRLLARGNAAHLPPRGALRKANPASSAARLAVRPGARRGLSPPAGAAVAVASLSGRRLRRLPCEGRPREERRSPLLEGTPGSGEYGRSGVARSRLLLLGYTQPSSAGRTVT